MSKLLHRAFVDYYHALKSKDSWDFLIHKLYKHETFRYEDIKALVEECFVMDISSSDDYLFFCRDLYQLLMALEFSPDLKEKALDLIYPLYRKLIKYRYWHIGHLADLYLSVISYFLGIEDLSCIDHLDLSSAKLFQSGYKRNEQYLPKKTFLAEKAIILYLTGIQLNDIRFINAAIQCCYFLMQFVDKERCLIAGLWEKETEFNMLEALSGFCLLFQCFSFYTSQSDHQRIYENLVVHLENYLHKSTRLHSFYPLLNKLIEKVLSTSKPLNFSSESKKIDLQQLNEIFGFRSFCSGELELNLTCSGYHSGIGTLSKKDVKIVSMGPHLAPLGETTVFGIHRIPMLKERAFKDIQSQNEDHRFNFSAWTRLVSDHSQLSDSWLWIQSEVSEQKCRLNFEIKHLKKQKQVYMTFFIKAKKATVSKNFHLIPGSLDRYLGKVEKVQFFSDKASFEIATNSQEKMQVIPLAGQDCFWDADFLLAYVLEDEKKVSFEIY